MHYLNVCRLSKKELHSTEINIVQHLEIKINLEEKLVLFIILLFCGIYIYHSSDSVTASNATDNVTISKSNNTNGY